jgi:hypothetical protein
MPPILNEEPEVQAQETTPVQEPETGGEAPVLSEDETNEWTEFAEEFDTEEPPEGLEIGDEEVGEEVTPEPEPAAVEPEPEVTPPAEPTTPEPEVQEEPTPPVEEAAAPIAEEQVPPPEEPQQSGPTAEELAQMRVQAQKQLEQAFELSKEDKEALEVDPGTAIPELVPKLGAQLYLDIHDSIMQSVQQLLPQAVNFTLAQERQRTEGEQVFFGKWPELRPHRDLVSRIGQSYMQMNPTANREDFLREVGAQAWVAARLPVEKLIEKGQQEMAAQQEAPPVTPSVNIPANPGSARPPAQAPAGPSNPFEQLAEEFLNDFDD